MPSASIIGLGPWGLCALERLMAAARRHPHERLLVNVVEPGRPGGGMYSSAHPDYLVLNTPCGQHSLYPFAPAPGEARLGLGFYEWVVSQGYHWQGWHCVRGAPGIDSRPISPNDFLPRRVMGEYLEWFYEALVEEAPTNVEVVHYRACATDVERTPKGQERVLLDDGSSVLSDHVIMTMGHVRGHGGNRAPSVIDPYPLDNYLGKIRPGEKVAIEGMGLVAIDVVTALTTGLGGEFEDLGGGRLRYLPSGREPVLYLFSRSGYPYCAKPFGAADPVGDYEPAICTLEAIARLKGAPGPKRQMDAYTELLPLVFAEMELCFYTSSANEKGGPAAAERVKRRLLEAWGSGTFADERSKLAKRYGEFVARDHFFVGEGRTYRDSADYQSRVYSTVAADAAEALVERGSTVKMGIETLRALRDTLRLAVEFKGLSFESHLDFVTNLRSRFARLVAGPPVVRSQQLLALLEAGIVQMPFGPRPEVLPVDDQRVLVRSMHLQRQVEVVADRFIRAHLDMPSLSRTGSPLLSNLVAHGRLRPLDYEGQQAGSIDLTEDFHPLDVAGEPQRHLWLFGILTEGSRYFTLYIPSPKSRVRAFLDAGAAADEIMSGPAIVLGVVGGNEDEHEKRRSLGSFVPARHASGPHGPLRVALVNNMPDAAFEETELQFRLLLENISGLDIDFRCYLLPGIERSPRVERVIAERYHELPRLYAAPPDVLVVTGAEPKRADLTEERYWPALERLVWWGRESVPSMLVSCLSAHAALWAFDGLPRRLLLEKCSGVYPQIIARNDQLMAGIQALSLPHSRFNEVPTADIEAAGYKVLARSGDAGWTVATGERGNCLVLLLQGHPEYAPLSLLREYRRDVRRYLAGEQGSYPHLPKGYLTSEALELLERFELQVSGLPRDPGLLEDFPFDFAARHLVAEWDAPARRLMANWMRAADDRSRARGDVTPAAVVPVAATDTGGPLALQ